MDRGSQAAPPTPALKRIDNIENLLMFVDDDLRETGLAMVRIEDYLVRTLEVLECEDLRREHVTALAGDVSVLDSLDMLTETVESLRRRLVRLSLAMR